MDNAHPSRSSGRLPAPTDRNVSFVICSVDEDKFAAISQRIHESGIPDYEIVRISETRKLAQGYAKGVAQARFETIVLCRDDIDIRCQTALSDILHEGLQQFDLIGVAGPTTLRTTHWLDGAPSDRAGLLLHGPSDPAEPRFSITCFGTDNAPHTEVQALDGVFIAAKKQVFKRVRFDSSTFDDIYFHDIDFTYRCHRAGLRLGVVRELLLIQESPLGLYGKVWQRYEKRFREKFPELGAARFSPQCIPASTEAASLEEAVARCSSPDSPPIPAAGDSESSPTISTDDTRQGLTPSQISTRALDAQLPAEYINLEWNQHPGIHLLMTLCPGEESLLADTLRSLAVQSYPEWLLTIVSGMTAPERLSEIRNIQWLVLRDVVHLNHVIDKMTAVSPGDWLARIRPGLILEPQALQVVTDAIHAQPQWRLICCDENSHETNVSQSSTRSKPALNPDPQAHQTRRSALVLAEKEAFIAAGYHGVHGEAGNEELVRHTLNQSGDASVGHLARMLAHSPSELHDPEHATTEDRIRQHDQAGSLTLAAAWSELCAAAIRPARSTSHISANHGHFSPPADRSISFVICSIDSTKFGYITERLKSICTVPHEIIRIDDARSLSEGYTRGSAKARFDTLVLCHDDIDLLCDQALADILNHALHEFDVVGVAGPRELKTAFWLNGGPSNSVGLVIHGPAGVANAPFSINYYDSGPERHIPVQALDGVFIAAKRQVFERITFDAERFDGFHLYDIDFTYRCHLAGFKIGVCKDLLLVHSSAGNFGNDWLRYEARFHKKFPHLAAATFTPKYSPAAIHAASKAEAAAVCRNPDHFLQAGGGNERSPITTPDNQFYEIWRKRTTMQEIDAQILAERMVLNWTTRPGIHLLLALHPGEESLLADTLDSLAGQLYPEWLLTVVTPIAAPEGLADIPNLQWLALRDASHIDYVIDEMAAASPGAWLARIEPGLSFEPQSLQVIADYINTRPDWKLIYCDEDTCEADGSYTTPLFKPDFNIDLLRSMAYFGSLVLVAKQAFLDSGRYGTCAGAENYDLALRIADGYGGPQIGHISQVLAHLPRKSQRAMNPEAETAALSTHLQRNRLDADILEGALFGTRQVRYRWGDKPLVSIVIQTRDREEYLRPLIDSLFERTTYPNFEIIIVDNDSADPDALAYFTLLQDTARARIVRQPGDFNFAAGANSGAAAAQGSYLLFLDNDTHIVQDDWLERLMAFAQRPDVGIVGPRLAFPESARLQHAPWVLGLRGTAAAPWEGELELTDPGYMGRALCDQEASAVSGSALLIRRSVFEAVGGLDAENLPFLDSNTDLCLRVRDIGLRTVWTPNAMVVHYGGISIKARQRQPASALADVVAARQNHNVLISRWLPRLANDPFYNRNLSLTEPFKPEYIAPIDWDNTFRDRPRILGIPLTGGAGEYRLRAPLRTISQAGLAQTMIVEPPKAFFVRILTPIEVARAEPDVLILHQPLDDVQTEALEGYARFNQGIKRIITIDDLITAVPAKNSFFKSGFKDARPRLRKVLGLADRLIVSTQPLADACADMIEDLHIMPNCLERSLWGDVAPPHLPRKKPRVGWAGAQQHLGDLELIYTVVEALADEVDWIFMGMCPEPLKPFVRESHGFVQDFRLYPQALARLDLDLAIAPLEIHTFNECKSNLRLLEYGAMGWPVICTDIYPYQNAPVTRLPNDPQKWISTIREQLAEPDALREAGLTLQRWVADGFILENHAASWFAAYGP